MEAPKCRNCQQRHWDRVCPKLAAEHRAKSTEKPVDEPRIEAPPKPPFDRNAYQRAYMREWRKTKKARDLAKQG